MAKSAESHGAADPDAVSAEGGKKKGGPFLMILVPVLLITAGGGAYLGISNYPAIAEVIHSFTAASEHAEEGEAGEEGEHGEAAEGEEGAEGASPYGEFMELSNIIVNPSDSNGRRILMVSLGIEATDPLLIEGITAREIVVRDTVIKLLGRRTVADLAAIDQRNLIRDELQAAVNGVLKTGEISQLYFTQYVLQ